MLLEPRTTCTIPVVRLPLARYPGQVEVEVPVERADAIGTVSVEAQGELADLPLVSLELWLIGRD